MSHNPFTPKFTDLPGTIPIFPLGSVLLLPHGDLPLNIFEPRYLAMVDDALASHKMIGMIQPDAKMGCAGKITQYSETQDGRYMIMLTGICRFKVAEELSVTTPYRQIQADWSGFESDFETQHCLDMDRSTLSGLLEAYFEMQGLDCDWGKINSAGDQKLITCLSMICPLEPTEKQALLEAKDCKTRAELFEALIEMVLKSGAHSGGEKAH